MSGEWFNAIHWRSLHSAINKTFKSMHQSVITKIKKFCLCRLDCVRRLVGLNLWFSRM